MSNEDVVNIQTSGVVTDDTSEKTSNEELSLLEKLKKYAGVIAVIAVILVICFVVWYYFLNDTEGLTEKPPADDQGSPADEYEDFNLHDAVRKINKQQQLAIKKLNEGV